MKYAWPLINKAKEVFAKEDTLQVCLSDKKRALRAVDLSQLVVVDL